MVNNYFLDVQEDKYKAMDMTDFLKEMGADVLGWLGFNTVGKNVKVETCVNGKSQYKIDNRRQFDYHTDTESAVVLKPLLRKFADAVVHDIVLRFKEYEIEY